MEGLYERDAELAGGYRSSVSGVGATKT